MTEAEKLRVAVAALEPYAMRAEFYDGLPPPKYFGDTDFDLGYPDDHPVAMTVGDLRSIRAALTQLKDQPDAD